jgi:hypothetical protein
MSQRGRGHVGEARLGVVGGQCLLGGEARKSEVCQRFCTRRWLRCSAPLSPVSGGMSGGAALALAREVAKTKAIAEWSTILLDNEWKDLYY